MLLSLASLSGRRLLELASRHPTAEACLEAVRRGEAGSAADREAARALDGASLALAVEAAGARLVAVGDPEYPQELLDLPDPPAGLFVRGGDLRALSPRVAVVGARSCTPYGREVAALLGGALAAAGVCVVSGGARGVDAAAHQGALGAGGPTLAVLGCGVDVAYPAANAALLRRVAEAGAVVSEYPPGVRAEPFRFPARNRVVAGLARGVVVVEGAAGSGSLITVDHAVELGREVFAVPGPVTSELAAVPLGLIREGATLIRGPDDLLADLGLDREGHAQGQGRPAPAASSQEALHGLPATGAPLSEAERGVLGLLSGPTVPDAVAAALGLSLQEVTALLVGLELRGLVRQSGGRYERRVGP
ncbi:MAG TPA: DNA-processing protein DprA [Actinomycetota bacterium]|nr:DNA-processing protein DprA [Actinomycetota bacterium]